MDFVVENINRAPVQVRPPRHPLCNPARRSSSSTAAVQQRDPHDRTPSKIKAIVTSTRLTRHLASSADPPEPQSFGQIVPTSLSPTSNPSRVLAIMTILSNNAIITLTRSNSKVM
jgi:hypothetical protein